MPSIHLLFNNNQISNLKPDPFPYVPVNQLDDCMLAIQARNNYRVQGVFAFLPQKDTRAT